MTGASSGSRRPRRRKGEEPLVSVNEVRGPLYNRKLIQDISGHSETGWLRVQDAHGYTRLTYLTPFVWEHHIPRETYDRYAGAGLPAPDDETVEVEPDPFGLDRPAEQGDADAKHERPQRETTASEAIRARLGKHTRRGQ